MALELGLTELSKGLQVCPTFDMTLSSVKLMVQNHPINVQPKEPKRKRKEKPPFNDAYLQSGKNADPNLHSSKDKDLLNVPKGARAMAS